MVSIIECRAVFYKFGWSGKAYVEAFNFQVQIENEQTQETLSDLEEAVR